MNVSNKGTEGRHCIRSVPALNVGSLFRTISSDFSISGSSQDKVNVLKSAAELDKLSYCAIPAVGLIDGSFEPVNLKPSNNVFKAPSSTQQLMQDR